jgi:aspartate aminotransferase-like enzyme
VPGLLPNVDPDGLLEYSVVYTDRSLNHMSAAFVQVMQDISALLKSAYNASSVAVVPGSGTFGMEAVARQVATDQKCLIIRNGWFSYRWSQIFEMGRIPSEATVLKARRSAEGAQAPFAPCPIDEVVATIAAEKPGVVFAPHVETASGMILPDDYIKAVAGAVHDVGGLFVLDCVASGTIWIDMAELGVDFLVSAPQKGWSGTPCAGLVMMSEAGRIRISETVSTSFAMDLLKWTQIMETYESSGAAYHATMPTDALKSFRDVMKEGEAVGFDVLKAAQYELGTKAREVLLTNGYLSVAADGFAAPGVVVCYTTDPDIKSGAKFKAQGLQIAGGVPLMCDEGDDYSSFRIGLFGLDKLTNVDRTVETFAKALADL